MHHIMETMKPSLTKRTLLIPIVLIVCISQLSFTSKGVKKGFTQIDNRGVIAFIRDGNIWTINPDGSGEHRTTSEGVYSDPALSPDTTMIAAVKRINNVTQLVLLDTATSQENILVPATKTPWVLENTYYKYSIPKWSPDGTMIYYQSEDGRVSGYSIDRIVVKTGEQRRALIAFQRGMDISPVDSSVAILTFSNAGPVGYGINVADPDGANEKEILPIENRVFIPSVCWNFDGNRLVFIKEGPTGNISIEWILRDGSRKGEYIGNLPTRSSWIACSPIDQTILYELNGYINLFNPDTQAQNVLTRGSQASWKTKALPAPTSIPSPECGQWMISDTTLPGDKKIVTTLIDSFTKNSCLGGFRFSNKTGVWGFGGYSLNIETRTENANIDWLSTTGSVQKDIYLTPLEDLELHSSPLDKRVNASVVIQASPTPSTVLIDSGIFFLDTAFALSPPGTQCVIEDRLVILMAIRFSNIISYGIELALRGDFKGAITELSQVLDEFYSQSSNYLQENGVNCGSDIFEKYIIKKPSSITKIVSSYMTWIPIEFGGYWKSQGEPDEIVLRYSMEPQPFIAQMGEDGKVYLGDKLLLDPSVEAPGCFPGGAVVYSPTGNHFVVVLPCIEGDDDAFVFNPDGSNKTRITAKQDYMNKGRFSWSPDGEWLVYQRVNSFGYAPVGAPPQGLVLYEVSSGIKTLLYENSSGPNYSYPTLPAWSPDGKWVAFLNITENTSIAVDILNINDRRVVQLELVTSVIKYNKLTWELTENKSNMLLKLLDDAGNFIRTYTINLDSGVLPTGIVIRAPIKTGAPTTRPSGNNPIFTASQNMFCRDGPGSDYQDRITIVSGQSVPVLARWSNNWLLVRINSTETRSKCCWIGGIGNLSASISQIRQINTIPDRFTCILQ